MMAVWLAVRPIHRRVGPTLLVVVAIFGLGTMVFGLTDNYTIAFLALVVISAADMISMYIRGSIVPLVTPNDQLGRVSAVEGVFIGASNELGAFESGVAARAFGLPMAIAGGGFITVAIAGTFAVIFPSLRRIDTFAELHTAEPDPAPATAAILTCRMHPSSAPAEVALETKCLWHNAAMDSVASRVEVTPSDDGWSIVGEVDASTSQTVAQALAVVPDGGRRSGRIVVETSGVSFIDSSGLRVLIELSERATALGARVVLASPSRSMSRLIELTGLDEMFDVDPTA